MADIFDEVDEELKQENFKKLWARYGRYVVAAAVAVVLVTAGAIAWRDYAADQRRAQARAFAAAIGTTEEADPATAAARLAAFARDADGGYAVLARLREAAARADAGERAAAADIYRALADDSGAEALYRDLARLLLVMQGLETEPVAELRSQLEPLLGESNSWRHTARELDAVLALRDGETALARERLQQVADDLQAPQAARARAAELLSTLESPQ